MPPWQGGGGWGLAKAGFVLLELLQILGHEFSKVSSVVNGTHCLLTFINVSISIVCCGEQLLGSGVNK